MIKSGMRRGRKNIPYAAETHGVENSFDRNRSDNFDCKT